MFRISKADATAEAEWFKAHGYYVDVRHTGRKLGCLCYWDVYSSYKHKKKGERPIDIIEWIEGYRNHRWEMVNDTWKLVANFRVVGRGASSSS